MAKQISMNKMLEKNHKRINHIFLGIGLTLFVMNLTAYISFVRDMEYNYMLFNTAVFSSMIVVLIAVYYLTEIYK